MTEERATRWMKLLQVTQADIDSNPLPKFTGELSHPDYQKIKSDADALNSKWNVFAEAELKETLEWLLTFYCKQHNIPYVSGMHELMAPFFLIGFQSVNTLYICFEKFMKKCAPTLYADNGKTFNLLAKIFHNVFLYNDPVVCNQLDAQVLSTARYTNRWFGTLFASCMEISLLLAFWELFLIEDNLTLPFFFGLVLFERNRTKILQRKSNKPILLQELKETVFDCYITELEELESMCMEAKNFQAGTPRSVNRMIRSILHGTARPIDEFNLQNSFVIELDVSELRSSKRRHYIIDLREASDYEKVHLPHSYNLPRSLKLSTEEYWLILAAFSCYFTENTGLLCNLSLLTNSVEEDQLFSSTLSLDLARRGLERISLIKVTPEYLQQIMQSTRPHETELCHRCEVNRNVRLSAQVNIQRSGRIFGAMIYHWLQEEVTSSHAPTPLHSEYNTPRTEVGIHGSPGCPIVSSHCIGASKGISAASTKIGSVGESSHGKKPMQISEIILIPKSELKKDCVSIAEILRGVKMLWGNQLYEGEVLFEQLAKDDPVCALHYSEAAFIRGLISGQKKTMKLALDRLELAEKLAEQKIASIEKNRDAVMELNEEEKSLPPTIKKDCNEDDKEHYLHLLVVLAEILLCKAGAHILRTNYIRASITLRKSWKFYLKCEKYICMQESDLDKEKSTTKEDSDTRNDIKHRLLFGKGTFNLCLSMTNPFIIKLAKLVGIDGDQEQGLKHLYECANSKNGIRIPASLMIILFWLLIYVPEFVPGKAQRYSEASQLIKIGASLYPDSVLFVWLQSFMSIHVGNLPKAIKFLEKTSKLYLSAGFLPSKEVPSRISFETGWCNFLLCVWDEAIKHLEASIVAAKSEEEPRKFSLLVLGVANCMNGNLPAAEKCLHQVIALGQKEKKAERWIVSRAQRFLRRKWFQLFPLEIAYLTDHIGFMQQEWLADRLKQLSQIQIAKPVSSSSNSFTTFINKKKIDADEYCICELLKSSILRLLKKYKEAKIALDNVLKLGEGGNIDDTLIVPHSLYEVGMLHIAAKEYTLAEAALNKAKEYKKYDFKKSLNFKIAAAFQIIEEQKASGK